MLIWENCALFESEQTRRINDVGITQIIPFQLGCSSDSAKNINGGTFPSVKYNSRTGFRSGLSDGIGIIAYTQPSSLISLEVLNRGIQGGLALPITCIQRISGIVSYPLILNNHILSSLPYFVSGIGHVGHFFRLFFGGIGQRVSVNRAGFHFMPLETYKDAGKRVDADNYDCPPKGRSLVAAQLFLYILELVRGLYCFVWWIAWIYTFNFSNTVRGFVGLIGGWILVAHSGVSVTRGEAMGRIVLVRFNAEGLKAIEDAAKANKQTLSEWIRGTLNAAIK